MKELFEFKLGSMIMDKYERKFLELLRYVDFIKDEQVNIQRFLSGLPSIFSDKIQYDDPKTLEEEIRRDKFIYDRHRGRTTFQKAWEDKKKGNMEQRKKGHKPPIFKNTSQGNPTQHAPKMTETLGKRPRRQPIKCWDCEGDHMYKYFPHRGERVNIVHNVQHDDTIEDMGRSMTRIYATLEKKKVEFHSDMIEVEGKINDQPISILIFS
jgi:hypothetical protein